MEWMILPYRRYAEFIGRSRRREYWSFALFYWIVLAVIWAIFGKPLPPIWTPGFGYAWMMNGTGSALSNFFGLASLVPALAVTVRRLHDIDRSGWWVLLGFVPVLGWFTLLVFMCLDGTHGGNRFGLDPKGDQVIGTWR